ncbi:MAG: succinylglutamate desuccinylase/aspartoacylase family protein [Bacillota bacterium]
MKKLSKLAVMALVMTFVMSMLALPVQAAQAGTIRAGTSQATPYYVVKGAKPGPTVMIVGCVHGNEEAGYTAAGRVKNYTIKSGTLVVVPQANKLAINANRRESSYGDLNRQFPKTKYESADTALAREIFGLVGKYGVDYLMDLHEGIDYYRNDTGSVGQTVIYYPTKNAATLANNIYSSVNAGMTGVRRFTVLKYPVPGSLARAAGLKYNIPTFILETADNPALSTRVALQEKGVNRLLAELGMR